MKTRLFFCLALFGFSYFGTAQENRTTQELKAWNLDFNYSIVPSEGFGGDDDVYELGLKYRFYQTKAFSFGLGINAGVFTDNEILVPSEFGLKYIIQPRVFTEYKLPFSKRLRLSTAVGYSYMSGFNRINDGFWGFNLNLGLTYDLNDKWFLSFTYDRVSMSAINLSEGFNNFRLGVGIRF